MKWLWLALVTLSFAGDRALAKHKHDTAQPPAAVQSSANWTGKGNNSTGLADTSVQGVQKTGKASDKYRLKYKISDDGAVSVGDVNLLLRKPVTAQGVPQPLMASGFIKRSGHQLVKADGSPLYFVGFNAYWMIDKASWGNDWGRTQIAELMAAAQRLGMSVGRTWAFNSNLPKEPGNYDERQFEGLDYVIYAAGRYNIRLILAFGNLWPAYFGPERWLAYATGSAAGKNVLDFYRDRATRDLYKAHISSILNRVNVFTGVKYKHDPTILGWDVMNEPRCPGCMSSTDQGTAHSWMREMMAHVHAEDSSHLVTMGTEGFFTADSTTQLHQFNPGAGAQCEGEDWIKIGEMSEIDFTTMHVYERHMEKIPVPATGRSFITNPDWVGCDFPCYVNWFVRYIQLHLEVNSKRMNKPIILEEFGLTWWRMPASDLKVLVEVVRQMLVKSAASGGAFTGAMIWSAAHNDSDDQDGYNVKLDNWPRTLTSTGPAINYPMPTVLGSYKVVTTSYDKANAESKYLERVRNLTTYGSHDKDTEHHGGASRPISQTMISNLSSSEDSESSEQPGEYPPAAPDTLMLGNGSISSSHSKKHLHSSKGTRALLAQQDHLDGFRRGPQRSECAHAASKVWRPMPIDKSVVDVSALRAYTSKLNIVDLFRQTTRQLGN